MNTDNMSILGISIDLNVFGFVRPRSSLLRIPLLAFAVIYVCARARVGLCVRCVCVRASALKI